MKIDKLNLDGKKDSIEVLDKIFSAKINKQLVSNVLYKTNANYKGRKAKTKQKNEIIGSTAKIYSQKGTGNARHASKKAPIFVGGGVAHGPKGESKYKIRKLNKSEKSFVQNEFMKNNNFQWIKKIISNIFDVNVAKSSSNPLALFINSILNRQYANALIEYEKLSSDQKTYFQSTYQLVKTYNANQVFLENMI